MVTEQSADVTGSVAPLLRGGSPAQRGVTPHRREHHSRFSWCELQKSRWQLRVAYPPPGGGDAPARASRKKATASANSLAYAGDD